MLVSALMGLDVMKSAYAHVIERSYRFYSYGDASLLLPGSEESARLSGAALAAPAPPPG